MASRAAKEYQAHLADQLTQRAGLEHLRVRARGPVLTVESGPLGKQLDQHRARRSVLALGGLSSEAAQRQQQRQGESRSAPALAAQRDHGQVLKAPVSWIGANGVPSGLK